jgi:predicted nucleic acid-binding protein
MSDDTSSLPDLFWDALVVQAAQVAGAEILYSEDLSDGQTYGTVRVINPLRVRA